MPENNNASNDQFLNKKCLIENDVSLVLPEVESCLLQELYLLIQPLVK